MGNDYIPPADAEFHNWLGNFHDYVNTNAATLGLTPGDVTPLTNSTTNWNTAYPAHQSAQNAAVGAKATKDNARSDAESVVRPLAQRLQVSPGVTDAQRSAMQISVRATTRTAASIPATAPAATIDTSQRLRHIINYKDSSGSRAKPAGVAYCEIWNKVGAPAPTDVSQLTYLGNASKTPQLEEYTGAQAGQMVWYWLRWINTRGEKGPWSDPVSATIPG
jgi:predicted phage tail protein